MVSVHTDAHRHHPAWCVPVRGWGDHHSPKGALSPVVHGFPEIYSLECTGHAGLRQVGVPQSTELPVTCPAVTDIRT